MPQQDKTALGRSILHVQLNKTGMFFITGYWCQKRAFISYVKADGCNHITLPLTGWPSCKRDLRHIGAQILSRHQGHYEQVQDTTASFVLRLVGDLPAQPQTGAA